MSLPAESGMDAVYTLAWRVMRLGDRLQSAAEFERAYRQVARPVTAKYPTGQYLVLHMRGPDANTVQPDPTCHDDPDRYCTGRALHRLRKAGHHVVAISNNASWANALLLPTGMRVYEASPYDDMALMLAARAIVQHAWEGWSSYSTVPALIAGIPVLNTYAGTINRADYFRSRGGAPKEMHTCAQLAAFVRALG